MLFHDRENVCDYNTEIRLFDSNGKAKELWQENALGKALRLAGREIRIPGITGSQTLVMRSKNMIVNSGHAAANAKMSGQGSYGNFVNIAIGTGTTAVAATQTALVTEITTGGGARGAATASQTTTSVPNDTTLLTRTFTFSAAFAVTEEGIFDNAASGGTMLARQVFAVVNVASGDQLTISHSYTT